MTVTMNQETLDGPQDLPKGTTVVTQKRLRNQLVYGGCHTLRWSGRGFQPHNLLRAPTDAAALQALLARGQVANLTDLSTCIRPCVRAPKGKKLLIADYNAIEPRVLSWLSGCDPMLDVFKNKLDIYRSFGCELFNTTYDEVTKDQRYQSKVPVLAGGYGQGGGQERTLQNGQKVKTGLWKQAEKMGLVISKDEAHRMVRAYRSAYAEVVYYWGYMEDAFLAAYKTKKRQQVGALFFTADKDCVKIELPSGRFIHYLNPHAWRGADGLHMSFDGYRKGGWGRVSTWGGVLTENVVQAVARDVLAEGMMRAEASGMPIVLHVHDEGVAEIDKDSPLTSDDLCRVMSDPIDWAPGLPLAAEGFESEFYEKK